MWDGWEALVLAFTSIVGDCRIVSTVEGKQRDVKSGRRAWQVDGGSVAGQCIDIVGSGHRGKRRKAGGQGRIAGQDIGESTTIRLSGHEDAVRINAVM